MNEDVVVDLKQFISGVITQQTADIRQDICRIDGRVENLETKIGNMEPKIDSLETRTGSLEVKIDDGFVAIADALEDMNNTNELLLKQHDKRLIRLERKAV